MHPTAATGAREAHRRSQGSERVRWSQLLVAATLVLAAVILPSWLTAHQPEPIRILAAGHAIGGRGNSPKAGPRGRALATGRPSASSPLHLILVVEENHDFGQVIGSRSAPFLNQLAARGTLLTNYQAITHPSLPNYLALTTGSTLGVHRDCQTCQMPAANLVDQLQAAGISWKAYYQGLPTPGAPVARTGAYTKNVDPFLHLRDISTAPARARRVVPLSQLHADLANGRLPRFVVIAPDLRHDMHNGTVTTGDAFLRRLDRELRTAPGLRGRFRLVVTFDEGRRGHGVSRGRGGGRVATIIVGSGVPAGTRDAARYNHYALLRSIERLFGLAPLRHAADPTTPVIPAVIAPDPMRVR
jgi:phosphatidylinositol-3-phosphatase